MHVRLRTVRTIVWRQQLRYAHLVVRVLSNFNSCTSAQMLEPELPQLRRLLATLHICTCRLTVEEPGGFLVRAKKRGGGGGRKKMGKQQEDGEEGQEGGEDGGGEGDKDKADGEEEDGEKEEGEGDGAEAKARAKAPLDELAEGSDEVGGRVIVLGRDVGTARACSVVPACVQLHKAPSRAVGTWRR